MKGINWLAWDKMCNMKENGDWDLEIYMLSTWSC